MLLEAEPFLEGDLADGADDQPAGHQLGQLYILQYFGETASSMDHHHVDWTFLKSSCHSGCTGCGSREGEEWQVIWCLGRLPPLPKTFQLVLKVYDEGICSKLCQNFFLN